MSGNCGVVVTTPFNLGPLTIPSNQQPRPVLASNELMFPSLVPFLTATTHADTTEPAQEAQQATASEPIASAAEPSDPAWQSAPQVRRYRPRLLRRRYR